MGAGGRSSAEMGWLQRVKSIGTTADRIAALTLLLREAAVPNLRSLDELLRLASKRSGARDAAGKVRLRLSPIPLSSPVALCTALVPAASFLFHSSPLRLVWVGVRLRLPPFLGTSGNLETSETQTDDTVSACVSRWHWRGNHVRHPMGAMWKSAGRRVGKRGAWMQGWWIPPAEAVRRGTSARQTRGHGG